MQKSIESNFQNKKEAFHQFKYFVQNIEITPSTRIEILDGNNISGELSNHSLTDSILNNSMHFHYSSDNNESGIEFELSKNGIANVNYLDTAFHTQNWSWNFEGNSKDKDLKIIFKYIGISEEELNSLSIKIKELDCEAIWVHKDKSVSIRFDGFSMYQYEYYFPSEMGNAPSEYEKLDKGIYSGFYDNGLFCGSIIFDK